MWKGFWSVIPHPEDRHPAILRPSVRRDGVYKLHREPFDTEILYEEPNGDSYLLEFFECKTILRNLLRLDEMETDHVMDVLWNFYYAEFNVDDPEIVRTRPEEVR